MGGSRKNEYLDYETSAAQVLMLFLNSCVHEIENSAEATSGSSAARFTHTATLGGEQSESNAAFFLFMDCRDGSDLCRDRLDEFSG